MSKATKAGAKSKEDKGLEVMAEKKFPLNLSVNISDYMRPVTDSFKVAVKLVDHLFDKFDTELLKRQVEGQYLPFAIKSTLSTI
jgi:predicted HTH domain antitoxin